MVYDDCKIYGAYTRKDGRQHIIARKNGKNKTVSYPKYLMELHLNRYLDDNEEVHHKNENFTDNDLDNLEVKLKSDHLKLHAKSRTPSNINYVCDWCNKEFTISGIRRKDVFRTDSRKTSKHFCSRQCVGRYGQWVQMNKTSLYGEIGSTRLP